MTLIDVLPEGDRPGGASADAIGDETGPGQPGDDAEPPAPGSGLGAMTESDLEALIDRKVEERLAVAQGGPPAPAAGDGGWGRLTRGFNAARDGMAVIFGLLGNIVQFGLVAFLIPFYFFFFSLSYPAVVRFGRGLLPEKNKRRTLDLLGKMDRVVSGFVRGRIVISLIMGLLLAIGWMICGVPYAMPLGFIVGIFCAVPYLGAIGVPLAIGFQFFSELGVAHDSTWWWAGVIAWPAVVYIVVQLIEAYVLTPMIAGKVTNLDPVTIIVAVLAGGSVMGVYGMILAIPLAACGKILLTDVLLPRVRKWTEGKAADPLPIDRD
jgi:predicted PurR-regulated permease PerM